MTVPVNVALPFGDDVFQSGAGLPTITRVPQRVIDQSTLDALIAAAIAAGMSLELSPPGPSTPVAPATAVRTIDGNPPDSSGNIDLSGVYVPGTDIGVTVSKAGTVVDARVGANAVQASAGVDDTANLAVLAAVAVALGVPLLLPAGSIYLGKWTPPSGLRLIGSGVFPTVLVMHSSYNGVNDRTIIASGTSDVTLEHVTIDGNLSAFTGVVTEQKHGLYATNVTRLRLFSVTIKNCKGDGLYVGKGSGHSADVRAIGLRCTGNYRNNLTIADLADGKFIACDFTNASGTAPQAGVDIEPNDNTYVVSDVRFIGCSFTGNAGYGIANTFYPGGQTQKRVRFVDCTVTGNGTGVYLYGSYGLAFTDCDVSGNTLDGVLFQSGAIWDVSFTGGRISTNGHHGINCQPATGSTVKNVKVIGVSVLDNGSATPGTTYYGMLWDVTGSAAGSVDGLTVIGCTSGNRDTSNQKYGMYFSAAVSNLSVEGNDVRGNVSGSIIFNDDATTRKRGPNVGVNDVAGIAADATLASYQTKASVTPGAGFTTITLPPSPEAATEYLVYDGAGTAAANPLDIVPNTGQSFANVGALKLRDNFGVIKLYYRSNKWYVIAPKAKLGVVRCAPQSGTGLVTIGSANTTRFYRVIEGGTISKVRVNVGTSSGNISVAAYRNSGTGLSSVPGTQLATSGAVACPTGSAPADVPLGATVTVDEGDWLAISADNATATFGGSNGGGDASLSAGQFGSQAAHPASASPSFTAGNNRLINLIGVP